MSFQVLPAHSVAAAQAWLKQNESELLETYRALLRIPSIQSEPLPNAPFGQANRDALDFMLNLAKSCGMQTVDMDGFCGYAEIGEGAEMVATFGHLDVVPVGPGWDHEPFGAEIDGDYVYARGTADDKGPTIAAFYAMRAVQQVVPSLPVRLRAFFGCNEESGFECIHHYAKTEPAPTFGVAPDSGWPLYHAEKGISNLIVEADLPKGSVTLLEIVGGQRPNIVIDTCSAKLNVSPDAKPHVDQALTKAWDKNVSFAWNGDVLEVEGKGKASHGSWPFGGDSAAIRVLRFLTEIAPLDVQSLFGELLETCHMGGDGIGIAGADEPSGSLTANVGVVETRGGKVLLTINIRYPVTWSFDEIRAKVEAKLADRKGGFRLASCTDSKPLYFPLDHPLVSTICDVHNQETGEDIKPGVMGGGTYARAIANTVSIGTGWEGDGPAHETDERMKIEHLHKMARIYAHILLRLVDLAATK